MLWYVLDVKIMAPAYSLSGSLQLAKGWVYDMKVDDGFFGKPLWINDRTAFFFVKKGNG